MIDIKKLLELDRMARRDAEKYPKKRDIYDFLYHEKGDHFTGLVGPRGVGKTVVLKQLALNIDDSFYLSLDAANVADLFELIKLLSQQYRLKVFLLDEIHYYKGFERALKIIYDFLNVRIIFSSSVSLSLYESTYDLSRRVLLKKLFPFSFREYIYFMEDVELPPLKLQDIIENRFSPSYLRFEYLFPRYLQGGLFPFTLREPDALSILKNVIAKIINKDIPAVQALKTEELILIDKVIQFIGKSDVDGISYSSVAKNTGITKYKAENYIHLLEKAFILNAIFPAGTNVLKEPKVLMFLPYRLIYREWDDAIGGIREDFFAEVLASRDISFKYLKSTRGAKTPDFLLETDEGDVVFEVGGRGKSREQFKGVRSDRKIILSDSPESEGIKRPLCLLGFL